MRWERLFDDLEGQFAADRDAERALMAGEGERLRLTRLRLRDRLVALQGLGPLALELGEDVIRGRIRGVGADVVVIEDESGVLSVVPLDAVGAVVLSREAGEASAKEGVADGDDALRARMGLGFLLRDAARRRLAVRVVLRGGRTLDGTFDRVGADHADLAVHDAGAPRRETEVIGRRIVPFAAIRRVVFVRSAPFLP